MKMYTFKKTKKNIYKINSKTVWMKLIWHSNFYENPLFIHINEKCFKTWQGEQCK